MAMEPDPAPLALRAFAPGDEQALHGVFFSSVHEVARRDYTAQQINAWAPRDANLAQWGQRLRELQPFVVQRAGRVAAYADVQSSGLIDHFYVAGHCQRQGAGRLLMAAIHQRAHALGLTQLHAHVSRTAQPFFERFGFTVMALGAPVRQGVAIENARMQKALILLN
jgi:putative acetyltransferase